ncbi:DUF6079 family protein [Kocuria sp. CPCC 205268]|uniref:DUF6079 family protein n=1 Tax=Kocuria oxytropis TaxID=3058913 RepID=UPI0034D3B3E2
MTSPLLKDVFDIPRRAGAEDYVLRLTSTVDDDGAAQAIHDYVVTPALADAFDQALDLVSSGIRERKNRGAFLAGSFGSGKSHFMAVLHALLRHRPEARAIEELQGVVVRHDDALREKNILPLAFHFLDASSMEEALFDGYVEQVRTLHPKAPLPAFYRTDDLLRDAEGLRASMGDAAFFAGLGGDAPADDEWGMVLGGDGWDRARYDAARAAGPHSTERQELVTALTDAYFRSYTRQGTYVDLDEGLRAMSEHAKGLGYDAVVLFLDELVLWLAFAMHSPDFFRRESQKITKLVEGAYGRLPVPLISFIARQMDLSQWFADSGASGSQQTALDQAFRHQEGRFATITLGDDNLPYVASKRLLQPKDDAARAAVEAAFDRLDRTPDVWTVLLDGVNTDEQHRGADEKSFRMTYPFSPALVSTLRSLSGVMQRDRTALKVMQQMLVERQDTMTIDEVIPVGDAFDHIVTGKSNAVLDPQAAALFRSAAQLYEEKLRPVLLEANNLSPQDLEDRSSLPPAYLADERLAKTLLLSAVATKVPALSRLTTTRLASLNHGSIVSPLPGGEARVVGAKVRTWASRVPEIHVDDDHQDPVVRVQLSDVDYESIVEKARVEDNAGRQRNMLRRLLQDNLELDLGEDTDMTGAHRHTVVWRGSRREIEIVFGNVRDAGDLPEDRLRATAGTWRFVIDHPFDEEGHSYREDVERIDSLLARNVASQTVLWLPRFLSQEKLKELRRLVVLDWLLTGSGDRWNQYSQHLSETDRSVAKEILHGQRRTLHDTLHKAVAQAYGVITAQGGTLQEGAANQVLWSLDRGFTPELATDRPMKVAFERLVSDAFDASYPGHPEFEPADQEVRVPQLQHVLRHVERAVAHPDHRVPLEGDHVAVRRVANALNVGQATETHFLFGEDRFGDWPRLIARGMVEQGLQGNEPVTVQQLRGILERAEPARGLRDEVADTVIIAWAALRQRAWFAYNVPMREQVVPGKIQGTWELRPQEMPEPEEWDLARNRASKLFGVGDQPYLTASAVNRLSQHVTDKAAALAAPAQDLVTALEQAYGKLGLRQGARLDMARAAATLVRTLRELSGVPLVRHLAAADLPGTDAMASVSLDKAAGVTQALRAVEWEPLEALLQARNDYTERGEAAAKVLDALGTALTAHEYEQSLVGALAVAKKAAWDWAMRPWGVRPEGPDTDSPHPNPPDIAWHARTVTWGSNSLQQLQEELDQRNAEGRRIELRWRFVDGG